MEGKPELIIGNYTDGNLVASLVASKLGVTQGTIAHALEKTKYEDSDVKWKDLDSKYHFSCQFTADMIAMNAADFIITSTYQEIAGRFTLLLIKFNSPKLAFLSIYNMNLFLNPFQQESTGTVRKPRGLHNAGALQGSFLHRRV